MNKEAKLAYQRAHRKANGYAAAHKYEKTINGFLVRVYRNMLSRVTGVQKLKKHLYLGLCILEKHTFYEFSKNDATFVKLFEEWKLADYDRRLTPSIDRINSTNGYSLDNIRWVTHSDNSREGALSRHR